MQQQDLESRLVQMLSEMAELRQQVTSQQDTINIQQSRLNELATQATWLTTSEPKSTTAVSTSRRKVLRRLAGGLVAGLALGGVSLAAGGAKEAEAAVIVNPGSGRQNVGALVIPPNQSQPIGITLTNTLYGLIATDGSAVSLSAVASGNAAVMGLTNTSAAKGVYGLSAADGGYGVYGDSGGAGASGIYGSATGQFGAGVQGLGSATSSWGVLGEATAQTSYGVSGSASGTSSYGVYGISSGLNSYGVYGKTTGGGLSWAGYFSGNVNVTGTIAKSGGSFKIDHPMDPANKYLYHSFVESPDMKNIYDGVVALDASGTASVELPSWFESLNSDFRYTLTPLGEYAPLFVAEEVKNGQFKIAGGKAGQKVSWQLTGIRQDKWAQAHRIPVEEVKAKHERGLYIHPQLFGQPAEKGLDYAQQLKDRPARPGTAKA